MTSKVVHSTSKGQITIPKKWRSLFETNTYVIEMHADQLIVKPLTIEDHDEVIFDAERDNKGKSIPVNDMIQMLKEIKNG